MRCNWLKISLQFIPIKMVGEAAVILYCRPPMDSKTYFLTYPQFAIPHDEVKSFLDSIKPVEWARVGTEPHEDGNLHMHVIVRCSSRVKASVRRFDIVVGEERHHPNIQRPRNIKDVLEYVAKEGNFTDFGPIPGTTTKFDAIYRAAEGGDREAFDRVCLASRISFQWAEHIWRQKATDSNTIREAGAGVECLQLQSLSFDGGSLLVIGPSGCGKSTWAKRVSPKPALWVTHVDILRRFRPGYHQSIIFDDMDFKHLPRTSQIYFVDQDDIRAIHCRYGTATIPARTPKIFTANQMPFEEDEAVRRRLRIVNIISLAL